MVVVMCSRGAASTEGVSPMSDADVLVAGPESTGDSWRGTGRPVVFALTVTTLLGIGAAVVLGAASSRVSSPPPPPAPLASAAVHLDDGGPHTVLGLAYLCLDAHHAALVANALRHNRSVSLTEARGWCD